MPKDRDKESFDDLFEPFELEKFAESDEPDEPEVPAQRPDRATPVDGVAMVRCPSCGADNPEHNRHCEQCGARVSQTPLPVAPPPMMRTTPGARALSVLAGVVIVVVLVAVFLNVLGGDDDPAVVAPDDTSTPTTVAEGTETTVTTPSRTTLEPAAVEASSSFPNLDPDFLIDGDLSTYWNDNSQRGNNAVLTFTFAEPVSITEMELVNIQEDVAFRRNYRIRDAQVRVDDLQIEIPVLMPDNNEPYRVPLSTLETRRVTVTVLSTYPGEPVGDSPSFTELALAEVRFYGTPAR